MSIKNLFGKSFKSYKSASVDVESPTFINQEAKERQVYLPPIDFATASNFVKYGSAKLYYENSIERIYNDYPYDGSKAEKIGFHLSSSYLDRWMFEDKYPKTTGYVELGNTGDYDTSSEARYADTTTNEFIRVWGGIHTASTGMIGKPLKNTFDSSMKYDMSLNRTQNWRLYSPSGSTIEFWLKKEDWDVATEGRRQVLLDLWNGELSSSSDYGRLTIELTGAAGVGCFVATYQNGTDGFYRQTISDSTVTVSSLAEWHHYAMSFTSASTGISTRFYVDGNENLTQTLGTPIGPINGLVKGYIGALQTAPGSILFNSHANMKGDGKFSGSLDEFRFWKERRTSRQIELDWFDHVGGGTNTDPNTTELGVYFKFNEGVVGSNATDAIVLDYSGRLANGAWAGYDLTLNQRNTGSAFNSSSFGFVEKQDPIMYSTHPEVVALSSEMTTSGSDYDNTTGHSLYSSMPNWITNQDSESNENLKKVTQVLSSYFDTLYAQISALSNLQNKQYVTSDEKPAPFAIDLLKSKGFISKDLLINAEIVELFANIDKEAIQFEDSINTIKNLIYLNIYNNLEGIYKSKGTEKSIRNLIRCFGIDDEIVKLNLYTDGGTHYFTDKAKGSSVKKKYINFNNPSYFTSSVIQTSGTIDNITFIPGVVSGSHDAQYAALTLEADIIVPYKQKSSEIGYFNTGFLSSSIFGFHGVSGALGPGDYGWTLPYSSSLSVYLVRDELNSRNAKFVIKNSDHFDASTMIYHSGSIYLESPYIDNIYSNSHWNVALRIKPEKYPLNLLPYSIVDHPGDGIGFRYLLDFYAVNHNFGEIENEVYLTSNPLSYRSGSFFLTGSKMVYGGAHKFNFTGSTLQQSDIQLGAVRGWLDYISNESIQEHNKDPLNFGQTNLFQNSNVYLVPNKNIPSEELTIFNWDFETVTTSDPTGRFIVEDLTSGTVAPPLHPWIDGIIDRQRRAQGIGFPVSSSAFIENEFLYAQKKELPEISYTNDNVYIKDDKQVYFSKDEDVSDNFYLLEKSMNQIASEEMLKLFSTIHEFSNLVGEPIDRYRLDYKKLDKARQHFFERVEQDLNLENFLNYYKWIDESISKMIAQLIPATANFGPAVMDVIESHILERNKYQRRVGLLTTVESTEASLFGIEEQLYNWKFGHAPVQSDSRIEGSGDLNVNCLWQKERKEKTVSQPLVSPSLGVDVARTREAIREETYPFNPRQKRTILTSGSFGAPPIRTTYEGSTYAVRKFSKPYHFSIDFADTIHGGINYNKQKNREFSRGVTNYFGKVGPSGAPVNIFGIGIGQTDGIVSSSAELCIDVYDPNRKNYYNANCQVGKFSGPSANEPLAPYDSYQFRVKSSMFWPFNIKSGTMDSGYNAATYKRFRQTAILVNVHSDTTDISNEIPMQGPFTYEHVGGNQNRHVPLNRVTRFNIINNTPNNLDIFYTRPEAWRLLMGDNSSNPSPDGAMGLTGPDYGGPYPDTSRKYAVYMRDGRAKRPVNIQNIQSTVSSSVLGNYQHTYEVVSSFSNQLFRFRRLINTDAPDRDGLVAVSGSPLLPQRIGNMLPATTNFMTLFAQTAIPREPGAGPPGFYYGRPQGNIFLATSSNRIPSDINIPDYYQYYDYIIPRDGAGNLLNKAPIRITDLSCSNLPRSSSCPVPKTPFNIISRFSAPGAPETSAEGYLDVVTRQYSVYNSLNYRNLSVRGSGSGESGRMRVVSADGLREGLRTVWARHCGKGGLDPRVISHYNYDSGSLYPSASYYKQHRNTSTRPEITETYLRNGLSLTSSPTGTIDGLPPGLRTNIRAKTNPSQIYHQAGPITLSFFIKYQTLGGIIFEASDDGYVGNYSWKLSMPAVGQIGLLASTAGVSPIRYQRYSSEVLEVDKWTHVIVTWDGIFNNDLDIYYNGKKTTIVVGPSDTGEGYGTLDRRPVNTLSMFSAYRQAFVLTSQCLSSSLADVATWNCFMELPQAEELYHQRDKGPLVSCRAGALLDYWRLGEEYTINGLNQEVVSGTMIPSYIGNNDVFSTGEVTASAGPYFKHRFKDVQKFNNMSMVSSLPQSTYQYAWIKSALSGNVGAERAFSGLYPIFPGFSPTGSLLDGLLSGTVSASYPGINKAKEKPNVSTFTYWLPGQKLRGYAPNSGKMTTLGGGAILNYEDALIFPTISDLVCTWCEPDPAVGINFEWKSEGSRGAGNVSNPNTISTPQKTWTVVATSGLVDTASKISLQGPDGVEALTWAGFNADTWPGADVYPELICECADIDYSMVIKGKFAGGSTTTSYDIPVWSASQTLRNFHENVSTANSACYNNATEWDIVASDGTDVYIQVGLRCGLNVIYLEIKLQDAAFQTV